MSLAKHTKILLLPPLHHFLNSPASSPTPLPPLPLISTPDPSPLFLPPPPPHSYLHSRLFSLFPPSLLSLSSPHPTFLPIPPTLPPPHSYLHTRPFPSPLPSLSSPHPTLLPIFLPSLGLMIKLTAPRSLFEQFFKLNINLLKSYKRQEERNTSKNKINKNNKKRPNALN